MYTTSRLWPATPVDQTNSVPQFKVILIGEVGVGKTAIFSRVRHPQCAEHRDVTPPTLGVDTCTRTFNTRYGNVTLTLWDTAGVERFRTLTRSYYRHSQAALLVFDLNEVASLYSLTKWQRDVIDSAPSAAHFLVGNKSDLTRHVMDDTMQAYALSHNCQAAFLTSAETGDGIETALVAVCEQLLTQHLANKQNRDSLWQQGSGLRVHDSKTAHSKSCCL